MKPPNNARQLAWRAMLSALAGSGLTAAGAGGSLSAALGATGTAPSSEVPSGAQPEAPPATAPAPSPAQTTTSTPEAAPPPTSTTTFAPPPPPQSSKAKKPSAQPAPSGAPAQPPAVVLKRKQKTTAGKRATPSLGETSNATGAATGANNVAPPPQLLAGQAQAIAAALASSSASVQALGFYRIPLFLLPIYKAAAVQYGVPWQILAAINEIETNFGADQSVSTAGAVGWMQFMPATWLQFGVDALDAGYADPYNPIDAIFAAGRYLRAAGAATNLRAAILAYNHSEEYVASVLLRAKLISSYPKSVVATLTGLTDARLPVTGRHATWATLLSVPVSPSSATASAAAVPSHPAGAAATNSPRGSAPAPGVAAKGASSALAPSLARPQQFAELTSAADAAVVAVQDGRVVQIGKSTRLGRFIVLRDVYGDLFTYAGLGSIAPSYPRPKSPRAPVTSPAVEAASTRDPAPSQPASAGRQLPLTLSVKTQANNPAAAARARARASAAQGPQAPAPVANGKVRLFVHPGNPDALAAAAIAKRARVSRARSRLPLRKGAVVATGTVLGRVSVPRGAQAGHLRFAIRPAGDSGTVDPRAILTNWSELQSALHPQGAKAQNPLLGATAGDVLLLSRSELERAVLADPGVSLDACSRHEVASGRVDRRALAVLAFLSRSGLKPTARIVRCSPASALRGAVARATSEIEISAISGITIAGHQGSGTITDLTIRTLLTLPDPFLPDSISSLMRYPDSPSTRASAADRNLIRIAFLPAAGSAPLAPHTAGAAAHSARTALTASSPLAARTFVSAGQWDALIGRIASLPVSSIRSKPSSAAIADPKRR